MVVYMSNLNLLFKTLIHALNYYIIAIVKSVTKEIKLYEVTLVPYTNTNILVMSIFFYF